MQLAHAGRKSSTLAPFVHLNAAKTQRAPRWAATNEENGWLDKGLALFLLVWINPVADSSDIVIGPSTIEFSEGYPHPKAMTAEDIDRVDAAFVAAAERCKKIGCTLPLFHFTAPYSCRIRNGSVDFIELHGAHGYLIHEFLSPLSNTRKDEYGGSLENRMRWPLRIIQNVRKAWDGPLFLRISATEWAEDPEQNEDGEWTYWGIEQSKIFVGEAKKLGIDFVDCSTGGNYAKQKIPVGPGYQVILVQ